MSARFYVNLPLAVGPFALDGSEAHHLATVCRLRPGAEVCLFNGDGHEYPARITDVSRKQVTLEIVGVETPQRELPFTLEVAAPLPKGDRSQFLIEKLTELGVTTFVPLVCQRSNAHPRDSKREKLERYVIEASKQCGRNVLMHIDDPTDWATYASRGGAGELRVAAHPGRAAELARIRFTEPAIRAAVGPEGGFTEEEITLAIEHSWQTVTLGPRLLRVETAAVAMAVQIASGRFFV